MRNLKYIFIAAGLYAILQSCSYDDKSSPASISLPEIVIDTTGISHGDSRIYTHEGEYLEIKPTVTYDGKESNDLEYEWRLSVRPLVLGNYSPEDYVVIGNDMHLKWLVDVPETPTDRYYHLWYRVIHKGTGVMNSIQWKITTSPYGAGIVVVDTEDGLSCDFTIVRDSVFTSGMHSHMNNGVGKPRVYERNLYSATYGEKFNGIIKGLFHQALYNGISLVHYMHGFSDNNRILRFKAHNYEIVAEGKDLFYDPNVTLNVQNYVETGTRGNVTAVVLNDGKLYKRINEKTTDISMAKFGLPFNAGVSSISPYLCGSEHMIFFDYAAGQFYWADQSSSFDDRGQAIMYGYDYGYSEFDPADMAGYEPIHIRDNLTEYYYILKKEGRYYFASLEGRNWSRKVAINLIDISDAPNIDQAISFEVLAFGKNILYATKDKVYKINYNASLQYSEFYDPGDDIVFIQQHIASKDATLGTLPLSNYAVLVATYDGTEGKVHMVYITTSGIINENNRFYPPISIFGGFKKPVYIASQIN